MKRRLQNGYNKKSLAALAVMILLGTAVGYRWGNLLRQNAEDINWLLLATWAAMTALLCWEVQPVRDLALGSVALAGGLGFEWWGTHTGLWAYFTGEKPPAWILPAWPVAALATTRIGLALERAWSRREVKWPVPYWLFMVVFAAGMVRFSWPAIHSLPTQAALVLMGVVIVSGRAPKRDVCLFVAGSALGVALEYWGTSRNCWTYHTLETPPPIAVAAHGFAQIVYARALSGLGWSLSRLGLTRPSPKGELAWTLNSW